MTAKLETCLPGAFPSLVLRVVKLLLKITCWIYPSSAAHCLYNEIGQLILLVQVNALSCRAFKTELAPL